MTPPAAPVPTQYIQLTNFADSATSPALSPDGRQLTFIRGPSTFFSPGQIYVKTLPDGEPVQLSDDNTLKMGPQFTPDGMRITYSTGGGLDSAWMDTWIVPVAGGRPQRLLTNAEGLTWFRGRAGQARVLFSEMTGLGGQMSIVTSTESRTEPRDVYVPPPPDGMDWKFVNSTYAIPLQPGRMLPPIPASGIQSPDGVATLPGAQLISQQERTFPGPNPSVYAFIKVSTQRNIYRVPVP